MRRTLLSLALVFAALAGPINAAQAGATILLVARDTRNQRVPGLQFVWQTKHESPRLKAAFDDYLFLLQALGKSEAEIEAALKSLTAAFP